MVTLDRLGYLINKILTFFTLFLLSALCLITFLQVIMRYVFNAPLSWTEEMVRYLLIWVTFLGFGLAVHKRTEMSVSVLTDILPLKLKKGFEMGMTVVILLFLSIFVFKGFIFAFDGREIMAIALPISFFWINLSAPLGGVFLIALYAVRLVGFLRPADLRPESTKEVG